MTMTFFTSSQDDSSQIWFGLNGDGFYVAPGVNLTDEDTSGYPAFASASGNVSAEIFGSIAAVDLALDLGGVGANAGPGTITIQIGSAGSVTSTNSTAIEIEGAGLGQFVALANAGLIDGAADGIINKVKGTITNNGMIYGGLIGVVNNDSNAGDVVTLNNQGTISGRIGVEDVSVNNATGHDAYIYNSGAIDGGTGAYPGYAVYTDSQTTETLTNYATGTLSGGVDLNGTATVENKGSISGGTTLAGGATLDNSGTMDQVSFTSLAAYNSFTNSGLLTGSFSTQGVSFTTDNSGTIDGSVYFGNTGASLTDSGTIKRGVFFVGGVDDTSNASIAGTGVVESFPGDNALEIADGAYDISNDGEILASGAGADGVDVHGAGQLVNDGAIHAGGIGVNNDDSNAGDIVTLENNGTISGGTVGVSDAGSHFADIYNSGAIDGGSGYYAVYSDAAAIETLVNYMTGTISGGVDLNGAANLTNEGLISGGTLLAGVATFVNSGTMDRVSFTDVSGGSSFANSGLLTDVVSANGASFTADNSGTIDGGVNLYGAGASLTDSGTIKRGVAFAGSAAGASTVRITRTGVVTSDPDYDALQVSAGAYDIWSAGDILASGSGASGVAVHGGGEIVNRGKITGGSNGVKNDAAAGVAYLYNYGSIDANGVAVSDTGGHIAVVHNYGALTGGPGYYAVYADSATAESLFNAGTIDGAVVLDAVDSTIVNTGTIDGGAGLFGGHDRFTNEGLVNGDIDFSGTGNVYKGALGSVTGTIYGSGADGVYYGGDDGETFNMTASGAELIVGGAGSDTFVFTAAGLTNATTIQGGGGTGVDTLEFSTAGTITASQLHHVSGIEQIDLANGANSITLSNALVASANGASLTVSCGSGNDTINASGVSTSDNVTVDAGQGVDDIKAGGTDTFTYASGSYSSGPGHDTISGANYALDKFDLNGAAVTTIDAAVTVGSLSTATFNASLSAAIGASHLLAHSAVLFTPNAGTLAGHTFLIADTVGLAGYQAGHDLVVDMTGAKGTLATGNFV